MDRIFLDANVLFSAAYKKTRLRNLWQINNVTLLSSSYAVAEAQKNLANHRLEALCELDELLTQITVINPDNQLTLPSEVELVEKDRPILLAAINAKATHLLTGDMRHFGHLFGIKVESVLILTPAQYFQQIANNW